MSLTFQKKIKSRALRGSFQFAYFRIQSDLVVSSRVIIFPTQKIAMNVKSNMPPARTQLNQARLTEMNSLRIDSSHEIR
jgi:hypothetical protein